jgi:uncharacterized membrane protein
MIIASKIRPAAASVAFAAVFACLVGAAPARAADPTFPPASITGLVPPPGMVVSKTFPGFEDAAKDALILLTVQPPAAYDELKQGLDADALKKQGITLEKRADLTLGFGTATLAVAQQEIDKKMFRKWLMVAPAKNVTVIVNAQEPIDETAYSDTVMQAALATLVVRDSVPDAERLSLLPFTIGDLAGFHVLNVLPGRAVVLADATTSADATDVSAHMFIGAFAGAPTEPGERAEFARVGFDQIGGIENVHITISEPLRIGNQYGFQTVAQAKDARTGSDIMVAQWLRFGGGGFLQMIGMAAADKWPDAQTRLRTVRDSIDIK